MTDNFGGLEWSPMPAGVVEAGREAWWTPAQAARWEAEAIRRGWLIPREAVRYEDVRQIPPRDPSIVTFKDWLDARPGVPLIPDLYEKALRERAASSDLS